MMYSRARPIFGNVGLRHVPRCAQRFQHGAQRDAIARRRLVLAMSHVRSPPCSHFYRRQETVCETPDIGNLDVCVSDRIGRSPSAGLDMSCNQHGE
jgi:hypothetical protein